jgi:hypothetical protein
MSSHMSSNHADTKCRQQSGDEMKVRVWFVVSIAIACSLTAPMTHATATFNQCQVHGKAKGGQICDSERLQNLHGTEGRRRSSHNPSRQINKCQLAHRRANYPNSGNRESSGWGSARYRGRFPRGYDCSRQSVMRVARRGPTIHNVEHDCPS